MDVYAQAASFIIKEQKNVIGPLALEQAKKVSGLTVTTADEVKLQGDGKQILEHLVSQYQKVFGQTSVEVCREAIEPILEKLTPSDIRDILKSN